MKVVRVTRFTSFGGVGPQKLRCRCKKSEIKTCVLCKHIIIHTEYKEYDKVSYILSKIGALVENAEYQDKIKLDVFVKKEDLDLILQNCLNYKLLEDRYKCI